jgi:hypothetical protein
MTKTDWLFILKASAYATMLSVLISAFLAGILRIVVRSKKQPNTERMILRSVFLAPVLACIVSIFGVSLAYILSAALFNPVARNHQVGWCLFVGWVYLVAAAASTFTCYKRIV